MRPPYHIIIADDEDGIRAIAARVVVRLYPNVTLSAVRDGADALIAFGQRGADLLITNNDMPHLNGFDLVRILRARQVTIPIVMISGNVGIEQQALAIGVTLFLAKPFSVAQLSHALTSLLTP